MNQRHIYKVDENYIHLKGNSIIIIIIIWFEI